MQLIAPVRRFAATCARIAIANSRGTSEASSIDNFFGLPADRTSLFCAAGVDDGRCAYGQPADGQFGNSGIGTERGPSFFNLDFSVGKKFHINETNYFDFRAEFFNGLNHVSWVPPGLNINSPATFGTDHESGAESA